MVFFGGLPVLYSPIMFSFSPSVLDLPSFCFFWLPYSKRLEILEYLPPLCQVLMDQEFIIGTRTLLEKSTFKYFPSFSMSKLGCQVIFPDYFLIVPYIVIKKKKKTNSKTWLSFPLQTSYHFPLPPISQL